MSIMDKVVAAVTPSESDEQRRDARSKAKAVADSNDWLSIVLRQHEQIEGAFETAKRSSDAASRRAALKELAVLLTGHSNAEESVIYPALVRVGEKGAATKGYTEQAEAKINFGELEVLDPMSRAYLDKLEHVCEAVRHHMYEEESSRFPDLKQKMPAVDQTTLTQRFAEEAERYIGQDPYSSSRAASARNMSAPELTPGPSPSH